MRKLVVGVVLCLLSTVQTCSQTNNATLGGTVSDASGALIPGATITAKNTGTGIVSTALSNEAGAYQFASLQTGTYSVSAELPGFQTQTRSGIALGVSQQVRLNFTLQVGSVAQTVEVSVAADTLIATSSSSVGTVLPEYKIRDLPLGGRSVMDLLVTTAGVGPTDGGATGEDGYFAGGRLSAVNTTRDGFVVSDGRYNHGAFSVVYTGPDLVDEQRDVFRQTFVGSVLTPLARQGVFRFFPGVDNQNATQNNPTVDRNGNPVRPASATGDLQSFSVFGRDTFRPGHDPTGFIQNVILARMPQPNDYTIGDGLNTAGIRWTRRIGGLDNADGSTFDQTNRDQFNMRLDHNINSNHKLSVVYTWERGLNNTIQAGIPFWPGGYSGANDKWPKVLNTSLVSTLSSSVVNELRIGYKVTKQTSWAA